MKKHVANKKNYHLIVPGSVVKIKRLSGFSFSNKIYVVIDDRYETPNSVTVYAPERGTFNTICVFHKEIEYFLKKQ